MQLTKLTALLFFVASVTISNLQALAHPMKGHGKKQGIHKNQAFNNKKEKKGNKKNKKGGHKKGRHNKNA